MSTTRMSHIRLRFVSRLPHYSPTAWWKYGCIQEAECNFSPLKSIVSMHKIMINRERRKRDKEVMMRIRRTLANRTILAQDAFYIWFAIRIKMSARTHNPQTWSRGSTWKYNPKNLSRAIKIYKDENTRF